MRRHLPHPIEHVRRYLRTLRLLLGETRNLVTATRGDVLAQLAALDATARAEHAQLVEILGFVHDDEHERRRRLRALRASGGYDLAYTEETPLVSVVIPTYTNHALLRSRSIPSVLAQTYPNLEIVVVGDAAPDTVRTTLEEFGDPRIIYRNLTYRGPYPEDPDRRWLVAGVPPYNAAVALARGAWIAPLDDDDAFAPDHLERLLELARRDRLELAYSRLRVHTPDGQSTTLGAFPPRPYEFGLQSTLYHAGLGEIFDLELGDGAFELPYDWGVCRRMMRAGVRMGMLAAETVHYYPSKSWGAAPEAGSGEAPPSVPESAPPPPEWEYLPDGWTRAARPDERAAVGWRDTSIARTYRGRWPEFLAATQGPGPLGIAIEAPSGTALRRDDVHAQNAVLAYAYALGRCGAPDQPVSVLDWGGAFAHHYVLAGRLWPGCRLDYHCRELPAVCAEAAPLLPEVTFHSDDACLERRYDLVMASSSLQYVEDWQPLVRRLAAAVAGRLFLTRVPVTSSGPAFTVLQRADAYGYETEYVGWVLDAAELLETVDEAGLELEREFALRDPIEIPNAPSGMRHSAFMFELPSPS